MKEKATHDDSVVGLTTTSVIMEQKLVSAVFTDQL